MEIEYLRYFCTMSVWAHAHKHMKVHTRTHMLPNSGLLLCSPLELAKALLQTAYFCFLFRFIAE